MFFCDGFDTFRYLIFMSLAIYTYIENIEYKFIVIIKLKMPVVLLGSLAFLESFKTIAQN